MRRFAIWLGLLGLWMAPAWAAASAPLTSLRQIHILSNDQARQALPVAFAATVTYYDPALMGLWVQDAGDALYVETWTQAKLVPGDHAGQLSAHCGG
jgi:hypothetical protein